MGRLTDWGGDSDLHAHLWSWNHGAVGVRHEAGILTSFELLTRSGEGRLCDSMVFLQERENDHISHCCFDRVRRVDESS